MTTIHPASVAPAPMNKAAGAWLLAELAVAYFRTHGHLPSWARIA